MLFHLTIFKLEPTTPNMSQYGHGSSMVAKCAQRVADYNVAIVWPGLYSSHTCNRSFVELQ